MDYKEVEGTIGVTEPVIAGQAVSDFVQYMMDRVCCFVEEVTAYGLQFKMPPSFSITEIPRPERKPDCAERCQLALSKGGMPLWSLAHHDSKFEET